MPLARGCLFYFPDALAAVAELSHKGNQKHNPGQDLHWSREKSNDHADCVVRHVADAGPEWIAVDEEDEVLHAVKAAWRSLAMAQIAIERCRGKAPLTAETHPVPLRWRSPGLGHPGAPLTDACNAPPAGTD